MAVYAVARSTHQALVATVQDTVQFTRAYQYAEIKNRDSAIDLFVTTGVVAPVVLANDTYIVRAGESLVIPLANSAINIISASSIAYSVTGTA